MRKLIALSIALLFPASLAAQATVSGTTSTTNVKSTITAPLGMTPDQRHAFESSIAATVSQGHVADAFPTVSLTWNAVPGASYRVLRYATLSSAPAVLAPREVGAQYVAQILPNYDYYFRVIALDAKGGVIDTTSAVHAFKAGLNPGSGADRYDRMGVLTGTCAANPPSAIALSWTPRNDIGEYEITITMKSPPYTTVATNIVIGSSFTQTGLPADTYAAEVHGYYVMHDYPAPGQVTKVKTTSNGWSATLPVTAHTTCQNR